MMRSSDLHWSLAPTPLSPHVTENMDRILKAIRVHMKMDIAFISEFLGPDRVFRSVSHGLDASPIATGDVIPMSVGYCRHIVDGRLPAVIADTAAVELACAIPETRTIPIGAHLSVPIALEGGRVFGTLCCFSHRPQPGLGQPDLDLLRTFGQVLASEITADVRNDTERRESLRRIESAIAAGDPDIVVQPIRALADRSLTGVECLARFASEPQRSPDLWFAEAQAVAYGTELELLAARKALAICADLPAPLSVSVNISPDTLVNGPVAEALAGFDPHRIIVEMTEHVPVGDYRPIMDALAPLRRRGIRIAIDDAGAGYSSLRHILSMQPDLIKLDISLTRNVDRDPVRNALAAALAEFARRAQTTLVAEGIETDAEFETLRQLGFHKGQGYLLGRPQRMVDLLPEAQQAGIVSRSASARTRVRRRVDKAN